MKTAEEIKALLERVMSIVGADDATVDYGYTMRHNTRFGENAITQNMGGEKESLSLTVAYGNRHGSSSTTLDSDEAIADLVKRAEANAKASPEDPEYMPPVGPQEYPETPKRFYESVRKLSPGTIADDVAHAIDAAKAASYKASGLFGYIYGVSAMANSRGLTISDEGSNVSYSLTIHGPKGSGAASACNEDPAKVDGKAIVEKAIATAKAAQDPEDIEPGDYTVIFEPQAVADLLGYLVWTMSARSADEGSTVFAGKQGEKIASDRISLASVIDSELLPSSPYGDSGLAVKPTTWIRNGVLEKLRYDRYWAAQKGREPDPNLGPLFMEGEDRSVEDLIGECKDGLLVKRLWYIRSVDSKQLLLTGMTRDGFFRIKDGKVGSPVKNLRFNESPVVFLANAIAMSRPERVENDMVVPAIMSREFTFSSTTESV